MNLILVLFSLIVLTASGAYVLAQDWRSGVNRLFVLYVLSACAVMCVAAVRITTADRGIVWQSATLLPVIMSGGSLLLIWLIMAIFIPHRYRQQWVRRAIGSPYLLITLLLALEWASGARLINSGIERTVGSYIVLAHGPAFLPVIILYFIGGQFVPLGILLTIAVRERQLRAPALWLSGGLVVSIIGGSLSAIIILPAVNYVSLLPLYLTFGWVTLRYQMFRPSQLTLHTAIEHMPDGLLVLDAQRRVRFANRAARQLVAHNAADAPALEEALALEGFWERTTPDDCLAGMRRFCREGEIAATVMLAETTIVGDHTAASVLLLRDVTAIERHATSLAASRAALEERTAELERSLEAVQQRDALIARLALPLIPLSAGVLVLPLIGQFNTERTAVLLTTLLRQIEHHRTRVVLLDMTGVTSFDRSLAETLRQALDGARLMGAQLALCGVRPDLAESIVHEQLDLRCVRVFASLQEGVAALLDRLEHRRVTPTPGNA